jgi:hypothetical protein
MASKKNKGKYVDDHREEEEAEESMTTKMMMTATTPPHEPTTPHQRSRSGLFRGGTHPTSLL